MTPFHRGVRVRGESALKIEGQNQYGPSYNTYCPFSRLNRTVRFSWTACFRNFSLYLQSVDGGGKRLADAEKQKYILQRIVSNCSFEDLHAFSLDTYIEKHVKLLEEGKCKPSTFIAHNAAIVAFIKFLTMMYAAECSFDYQPTMTRIKQWNEFHRRRHQERNARGVSLGKRSRSGGEKDHGEILMAYQITKNSQRPSAVRNMLVEELNHGCRTRKGRWIIRCKITKHSQNMGMQQLLCLAG
ncbi:unnamed protein product [Clavelina lepadiformis]|uniref:Core-binding (CB) domain-containing protein n=1 Tax=Clavelina lepadiformis TaxID=159417 RepID=A0ABP0F3C8_CLALP